MVGWMTSLFIKTLPRYGVVLFTIVYDCKPAETETLSNDAAPAHGHAHASYVMRCRHLEGGSCTSTLTMGKFV